MLLATNNQALDHFLKKHPHSIVLPSTLHDFYWLDKKFAAYQAVSVFVPDGMPVVALAKSLSASKVERIYGPDLMKRYLSEYPSKKHLLVGESSVLQVLEKNFPFLHTCSLPRVEQAEELVTADLVKKITQVKPDYVWLGIGSPKQVELAYLLRKKYQSGILVCVGAAFDYLAGAKRQAPSFLQQIGLEWLFRLLIEPKRLWQRYLVFSPIGLLRLLSRINSIKLLS